MAEELQGKGVARGAEASIRAVEWLGWSAYLKDREAKTYRPKSLDERLRKERTRTEVRLLVEARKLGIRTPIIYDLDLAKHRIILEALPGPTLKELLDADAKEAAALEVPIRSFGATLGRLHAGGISHGDLTSSNVMFPDGPSGAPAFIDLSMGSRSPGVEELAIDLHLVEEDFRSLHAKGDELLAWFYEGYAAGNPTGAAAVRTRAKEIRGRVRYA
ncbi:MAG: Kae1-associated serine/threonine protein kinase [Thermoplasmata archaeon]|nr:Kae1-associated serine/threonine protein kinase [Thermoplasmata archaeon]MCI4361734.1 Kae1-associated serine/threonine protein kinase [Thermoplasmata archaeon]